MSSRPRHHDDSGQPVSGACLGLTPRRMTEEGKRRHPVAGYDLTSIPESATDTTAAAPAPSATSSSSKTRPRSLVHRASTGSPRMPPRPAPRWCSSALPECPPPPIHPAAHPPTPSRPGAVRSDDRSAIAPFGVLAPGRMRGSPSRTGSHPGGRPRRLPEVFPRSSPGLPQVAATTLTSSADHPVVRPEQRSDRHDSTPPARAAQPAPPRPSSP